MKIAIYIASLPEDSLAQRQFPLGPGYIGAFIKAHIQDVDFIITAEAEDIFSYRPDILGISSVSQCYSSVQRLAKEVKEKLSIPIILGGYHISAIPSKLDKNFDIGVLGEGELTMLQLVRLFREEKCFAPRHLRGMKGICFHDSEGVKVMPPQPPIMIDTLPYPMRNIRPGARNIQVFSSRGCAYRCKYCASSRHWGKLRTNSAEYFVRELHQLRQTYDATSIYLMDDLFFARRQRVFEILKLMEKDGLIGALSFHGFITSNLASRDLLEAAKYMGFRSIRFGAETGSERLLKSMKGSWASVHSHQKCIDLCAELGLEVSAAFMLGTPGETETDLESTYAFLKRNQGVLKINGLYLTTPIPGTPYWDMAMQKGLVDEDMDWDRLNFDFRKIQSFDPKAAPYMNNESMPIEKVLEYAHRFQTEFAMVT
jgi:radical SAM superfamily enzyme YgiQ (UPF0313 family)